MSLAQACSLMRKPIGESMFYRVLADSLLHGPEGQYNINCSTSRGLPIHQGAYNGYLYYNILYIGQMKVIIS